MAQVALDGGNTITPSAKRISAGKAWCFTLNNYEENQVGLMAQMFQGLGMKYIIGQEVAPTTGTPHLQGYVKSDKKFRPLEKFKWDFKSRMHWEKAKGSLDENYAYCSKEGVFKTNIKRRENPKVELRGWQDYIREFVVEHDENTNGPDLSRDIHWIWSREGARGKSTMVRWLAERGAVICGGKASDMKYMIAKHKEVHDEYPEIVVFDVPRSAKEYLSYTGIEEIKNGVFCSTKYECSMVVMPQPMMLIFANFPPNMNNKDMSKDRFRIYNVDKEDDQSNVKAIYPEEQIGTFLCSDRYEIHEDMDEHNASI